MLTKTIKRDEVLSCRQLKSQHYNKISDFSLINSKSIVKIDLSSKIFFSTLVKKEHGFQGKHKQVHYQQCLLVAFQKTGEVNLGYILKSGGIPTFQNYQSFLQHSLPLTKCRDIQSISDKEVVFFFHQNEQKCEWKFKFYQKEIKQKWMVLLMMLAYQKQYKKSITSILNEEMLVQLSKENLNSKKYASEIKVAQFTIIDQQVIKKNKVLEDKIQQLTRQLSVNQVQRLRLQQLCKNRADKIIEMEGNGQILNKLISSLSAKLTIFQQKLQFTKLISDKIQLSWLKLNNEVKVLNEIKKKYEQIKKQDQFEVLSQYSDQDKMKNTSNPEKNLNQLKHQVEKSFKQLGLEINRFKVFFSLVSSDQTMKKDI